MASAPGDEREIPNFDSLARLYRWIEYLSFGPMLERCRFRFLPQCAPAHRALVLGDGDGRFTARLLATNPQVEIDAIDASAAMLRQLRRRAQSLPAGDRLQTSHADLREQLPGRGEYDLVVSHFFVDCLTEDELAALAERTLPHLTPDASWLISEFAVPEKGWRRIGASLLVRFLYYAFRKMTRLQVRRIPNYARVLTQNGFARGEHAVFLGGLLVAEIWRRERLGDGRGLS